MVKSRILFMMLAGCLIVSMAVPASAVTISFRHATDSGYGYVNLTGDSVSINSFPTPDATPPDWQTYHLQASGDPAPADFSDTGADRYFVLFGLKDLLAELPITSGQITTATLTVIGSWGDGDTIDVYRVTTDWLADPAGSNESDTSGSYADVDTVTTWSGGAFSTADFELASKQSHTYDFWPGAYTTETLFDATQVLKDSITAGAFYGWCMTNYNATDEDIIVMNPAAGANSSYLTVEFTDANTYTLTVDSGTGDGTYNAGDIAHSLPTRRLPEACSRRSSATTPSGSLMLLPIPSCTSWTPARWSSRRGTPPSPPATVRSST